MPTHTYPIVPDGAHISVMVDLEQSAIASLVAAGLPIPAPLHGTGIVDTGSDITCVAWHLLHQFQIIPRANFSSTTVGGQSSVRLFRIGLSDLPPLGVVGPLIANPTMIAMELPQIIPKIDVLIGRDFFGGL